VSVELGNPWWLLLVVLAVPASWVGLRWFVSMSRVRRWSAVVLRTLLIALVAGLLAGVSTVSSSDKLATIVVVDVSGSVRRFVEPVRAGDGSVLGPIQRVRRWIERAGVSRGPDDLLGVVLFDGRAVAVASPSRGDPLERSFEVSPVEGSDLAGALRYASSLVPPDAAGRLVLVSDGNETTGDAVGAAEEIVGMMGPGSLRVDAVPLEYDVDNEVLVESLDTPPRSSEESTVTVRVTLRALSATRGVLRLTREGRELDINGEAPGTGRALRLEPGVHTELIETPLPKGRLHRFEAVFEPESVGERGGGRTLIGDTHQANNRAESFTLTPGRGSVLLVDGVGGGARDGAGATLVRALRESGASVELVAPDLVPESLLALQSYDLIILQNVAADELTERTRALLAEHVSELGGGLVMIGGEKSFGAGGWRGSALEPVLPVKLDLPERAVVPELAVVFVLDRSGSMSQHVGGSVRTKQEIANESAAMAISSLDEQDLVGVIAFDNAPTTVVPLAPNSDPRSNAARVVSIAAGGGTNLPPALDAAASELRAVESKAKHIIVLTDGKSQGAERLPDQARRLREEGINLSAIGVGDADIETLNEMAGLGGGRFYHAISPHSLPRLFLRAVRVIRQPMIREIPFTPIIAQSSPMLRGVSDPPELGGLALTQRRDDPTVTTAMLTRLGEPVLAHWKVELGTVVAFTSDAHARWSEAWLDWPGYQRLWTNVVRVASRPPGVNDYELSVDQRDGSLRVRMEAFDREGEPLDLLDVPVTIYTPSGERVEIRLAQTAPGTYEGAAPAAASGSYITVLKPELAGTRLSPVIGGASVQQGAEFRRLESNADLLRRVVDRTGGRLLDINDAASAALFDRSGIEPRRAMNPMWRSLLVWTLVVLLLDVGTRRVAWDRLLSREFGGGLREAASQALHDRSEQAARTLHRLRGGRRSPDPGEPAARTDALSAENEAAEVSRRERERQQQARLESLRRARTQVGTGDGTDADAGESGAVAKPARGAQSRGRRGGAPASDAGKESGGRDSGTDNEGTSGLLAAKRRARDRFRADESEDS